MIRASRIALVAVVLLCVGRVSGQQPRAPATTPEPLTGPGNATIIDADTLAAAACPKRVYRNDFTTFSSCPVRPLPISRSGIPATRITTVISRTATITTATTAAITISICTASATTTASM